MLLVNCHVASTTVVVTRRAKKNPFENVFIIVNQFVVDSCKADQIVVKPENDCVCGECFSSDGNF